MGIEGKFIIAGQNSGGDLAAEEITATGGLFGGFNSGSVLDTSFTGAPQAIAIDSGGNVILAGSDGNDFAIVRLTATGGIDTTFNTTGEKTVDFDGAYDVANAVVVESDGDIIAGGYATNGGLFDAAMVALNPLDGSIDTTSGFGTGGMVDISTNLISAITGMAVDADGNLVTSVAWSWSGGTPEYFGVARFTPAGVLDTSFNGTGYNNAISAVIGSAWEYGVAINAAGQILVVGSTGIYRFDADGTLDTTFGSGGHAGYGGYGVLVQSDGKIVIGGAGYGGYLDIVRLDSDGTADDTFADAGYAFDTAVSGAPNNVLGTAPSQNVLVLSDGDVLVAADTKIVAFHSGGALDYSFGTSGVLTTTLTSLSMIADGSDIVIAGQTSGGDFAAMEITATGGSVSGFNGGSVKDTGFAGTPYALTVDSSGRIILAGTDGNDFMLVRLNSDGSVDTTGFGTGGETLTDFNGYTDIAYAVVMDGSDIIAAGLATASDGWEYEAGFAKYDSTGQLVGSGFGTGGKAVISTGIITIATGLAIDSDGKIDASGLFDLSGSAFDAGVMRLTSAGALDTSTFNTTGYNDSVHVGPAWWEHGIAIDPDGNILMVSGAGLTRFTSSGALDTSFATYGTIPISSSATAGGYGIAMQSDGKIIVAGIDSGGHVAAWRFEQTSTPGSTWTRYYIQQDANWNVTSITDDTGTVLERYIYDPYGNVTVLKPDGSTRGDGTPAASLYGMVYLFQGGRWDATSQTYEFQARDYSPVTQTWLEEDPAGYVDGGDLYLAESDNVVSSLDPSGLWRLLHDTNMIIVESGDTPGAISLALTGSAERWEEVFPSLSDPARLQPGKYQIPDYIMTEYRDRNVQTPQTTHVAQVGTPVPGTPYRIVFEPDPNDPLRPHFHVYDNDGYRIPGATENLDGTPHDKCHA